MLVSKAEKEINAFTREHTSMTNCLALLQVQSQEMQQDIKDLLRLQGSHQSDIRYFKQQAKKE